MTKFETVLQRFDIISKENENLYRCNCPVCQNDSLYILQNKDDSIMAICNNGCAPGLIQAIIDAPVCKEQDKEEHISEKQPMKLDEFSLEESIPNLMEEDFVGNALYDALYAVPDKKQFLNLKYKLKERAKKVGKSALAKLFDSRCDELCEKKRYEVLTSRKTDFADLPNEIKNMECGKWNASDKGIRLADPPYSIACSHPILPVKLMMDQKTGKEVVRLAFKRDSEWKYRDVEKNTVMNANKIIGLSDYGVSVGSDNAKALSAYLKDVEDLAREKGLLPIAYTTSQLGWTADKKNFVPYDTDITFNNTKDFPRILQDLEPVGSLEIWVNLMKKFRSEGNIEIITGLIASFASPIVGLCGYPGFCFDIFGISGGGKSLIMKVLASVWADVSDGAQFVKSFRNTDYNLEQVCAAYHSLPLYMDDASDVNDKQRNNLENMVYQVSNGISEGKGKRDGGIREIKTWKLIAIMTSESILTSTFKNGGSYNRVLQQSARGEYIVTDIDPVVEIVEHNHGLAGPVFIQILKDIGRDGIKRMVNELIDELTPLAKDEDKTQKQILPVAILLVADRLTEKYIFQDGKTVSFETALGWMESMKTVSEYERFYNRLVDAVYSNPNNFEGMTKTDEFYGNKLWGKVIKNEKPMRVALNRAVLEDWCMERGVGIKQFLSWLDDKGLLVNDKDGKRTVPTYLASTKSTTRMYVILFPEQEKEKVLEDEMKRPFLPIKEESVDTIPFDK